MEHRSNDLAKAILNLSTSSSIAIFPHIGVDGDCLGSTLALKLALESAGYQAHVITNEPVPLKFSFLPGMNSIIVFSPGEEPARFIDRFFHTPDLNLGILVDCSSPSRIGESSLVYECAQQKMVFDHHFTSTCEEELCYIDSKACASGEIIYNLISSLERISGKKIFTRFIATLIMAAIVADTGGFRYSNTNWQAFSIAHDLIKHFPVNLRELTFNLFEKTSLSRIRLQGKAYEAAHFYMDNQIAICPIHQSMIEECGALEGDVDGICNDFKNIEGVVVAFVMRERTNGEIRVNIRSSEPFDASSFASQFGGGGHMRAAGCTISDRSLEEAEQLIALRCSSLLEKQ